MTHEQQPALSSSALSPGAAEDDVGVRFFFFGASSEGGAYARMDK